jgi:hypothetical protein
MNPTADTGLLDALTRAVTSPSAETITGALVALVMVAVRIWLVQRTTNAAVAHAVLQVPTDLHDDDHAVTAATRSATDRALEAHVLARPRANVNLGPKMRAKVKRALKKRKAATPG